MGAMSSKEAAVAPAPAHRVEREEYMDGVFSVFSCIRPHEDPEEAEVSKRPVQEKSSGWSEKFVSTLKAFFAKPKKKPTATLESRDQADLVFLQSVYSTRRLNSEVGSSVAIVPAFPSKMDEQGPNEIEPPSAEVKNDATPNKSKKTESALSEMPRIKELPLVCNINISNLFDEPKTSTIKNVTKLITSYQVSFSAAKVVANTAHGSFWPRGMQYSRFFEGSAGTAHSGSLPQSKAQEMDHLADSYLSRARGRLLGIVKETLYNSNTCRYDVILIYSKDNPKIKPLQPSSDKGEKEAIVEEIVVLLRQTQGRSNFVYVDGPPDANNKKTIFLPHWIVEQSDELKPRSGIECESESREHQGRCLNRLSDTECKYDEVYI